MRLRRRRAKTNETVESSSTDKDDISVEFTALIDREWARLAAPGTWWTGEQRIGIAAETRAALAGEPSLGLLHAAPAEACRRVAAEPATIRAIDLERWESEGLDGFAFVELVGIVSRLTAVDVASFGLGLQPAPLPEATSGEPALHRPEEAAVTTGWAPTIGPAGAPNSLSAVPAEAEAMFDIHGVMYATMDQMFDLKLERNALSRPQIELVAARTSRLNDCFY